jgi:excisionase family DNA binding protein
MTSTHGTLALQSYPDYSDSQERDMSEQWPSVAEAAELLGVHPETIRRMIRREDLPAEMTVVNGRARWRIRYDDAINADVNPPHRPPSSNENETS